MKFLSALTLTILFLSAAALAQETTPPAPGTPEAPQPSEPADPLPPPPMLVCALDGTDLSEDDAAIVAAIESREICWEAVYLANACSSGVASDVRFTAPAFAKCHAQLMSQSPTAAELQQLKTMRAACDAKWSPRVTGNSIYRSVHALCSLNALSWLVDLTAENGL